MDKCIHRLRSTLDNLVDVTSLETDRFLLMKREYDFAGVVRMSLEKWRPRAAEREITMIQEGLNHACPGLGDPERLSRAIGHIVENAIKFTPPSGAVGIATRETNQCWEVIVADTGPGIPSEKLDRIFEAFYQVDGSDTREHGGVGVGLAIARRTARGLGGDVTVISPCDQIIAGRSFTGSVFALRVARLGPENRA